jgi:hypothetical protein
VTTWAILDLCARRGVRLVPDGNGFKAFGPADARAELKRLVLSRKAEILAILRSAQQPGGRPLMPVGLPNEEWHRDWRGRPVNLHGLRPGENGRPLIFVCPRPEGVQ